MRTPVSEKHPFYCYISTRACYDPVRTIYVCAPDRDAADMASLERFAVSSGWRDIAEADGAVLVLPLAKNGWSAESLTLLPELYAETQGKFPVPQGEGLYGRGGKLWCWETLICLAGYGEGAVYAGNALAAAPGRFTAAALVGGAPEDFSAADAPSAHFMTAGVSAGYDRKNRDIPVRLWMFLDRQEQGQAAARYFSGAERPAGTGCFDGVPAALYGHDGRVRLSAGAFGPEPALSALIYRELFAKTIRWKCGPDGALADLTGREELIRSGRFARHTVRSGGRDYDILVHVPKGREGQRGLPLLISLHGRGEPAWMFCQKNGWEELADETGAFLLAVPDSPENIWFLDRDGGALGAMVELLAAGYGVDRERIYLTGFSNGAMMTRQAGTRYASLFAGLSAWNGPPSEALPGADGWQEDLARLEEEGWQMPYFAYAGDRDGVAPPDREELLARMLRLNGCADRQSPDAVWTGTDRYAPDRGYRQGERMTSQVWLDGVGTPRVAMTVMGDMPHGAIPDESRSAWELLRRYRRPAGSREIAVIPQDKNA